MINKLYDFVDRLSTWPIVAILIVVFLLANQAYLGRQQIIGNHVQILDSRRWYTPEEVQQFFNDLGDQGAYYIASELTLDIVYPLTYGLLFAVLLARTWGPRFAWTLLLPLFTVIFDLLENGTIAYLYITSTGAPSQVALLAATFTASKTILYLFSLVLILNGGIIRLFRVNLY